MLGTLLRLNLRVALVRGDSGIAQVFLEDITQA